MKRPGVIKLYGVIKIYNTKLLPRRTQCLFIDFGNEKTNIKHKLRLQSQKISNNLETQFREYHKIIQYYKTLFQL